MTQLLRKQNRSHDCSLSRIAGGCLCFFAAGCVDSGQLFFLLFCAPVDIKGVCSCLKSSSAEAAGVLCLQSHRHLCMGQCISLCSSFPPVSTYSAHLSHHGFHSNCGLLLGCQCPKQQKFGTSRSCHMLRVTHQAFLAHIFWCFVSV